VPLLQTVSRRSLPETQKEYIDKDLVRFVHKDIPLTFHKNAKLAASMARCSKDNHQYWKIYKAMFDGQKCLECRGPQEIAISGGMDKSQPKECLKNKSVDTIININTSEAQLNNISGTPTFVIGPSKAEAHWGRLIEGAAPWTTFKRAIDLTIESSKERLENDTFETQIPYKLHRTAH
jgi:protein-disulfide isomerase